MSETIRNFVAGKKIDNSMQFTIQVPDKKASFFLELIKSLKFAKVAAVEEELSPKEQLKADIRQAVKEVNLIKQGKMKGRPVEDLLNEL